MRRVSLVVVALLSLTVRASAVGSWDGNPPGTLEQLTGHTFAVGAHVFPAGRWRIDIAARYTAWADNVLTIEPLHLIVGNSLTFTSDVSWTLGASTRDFPAGVTSNRWKYTEAKQIGETTLFIWQFGLEDMRAGDDDYQDAVGIITRLPDGGTR